MNKQGIEILVRFVGKIHSKTMIHFHSEKFQTTQFSQVLANYQSH